MDEPIGTVVLYEGIPTIPDGWVLCNGQVYPISEYADLFAAIGTKFGGDDTTFKLPAIDPITDTIQYIIRAL